MRNAACDGDAVLLDLAHFVWVVGDELDALDVEAFEDVCGDGVVSFVVAEAEGEVCFDGIEALVLEGVGFDFVDEADAAAFLAEVDEDASFHGLDAAQAFLELVATIAAEGAHDVACEAFGVETCGDVFGADDIAVDHRDVFFAVSVVPEGDDSEAADAGG